ncbi:MFS transporter [Ktedonosporobacter rubrisoli]|uniref:MFS transporter n=2 Tax=Ktedonosporobacter rubrisoli TaxID=2509675 RepID=A0A4P6K5G2_KTERU|nr:MFS transporter [Ktedonosporobacter rubrisoli]
MSNKLLEPAASQIDHDPYRALRFRNFRLYLIGTFVASLGEQMISVAIGWELYERTNSALVLAGVGLVQIIPILLFSLPAGHLADHFNRKYITLSGRIALGAGSLGLTVLSYMHASIPLIYACLLLMGAVMAFVGPANSALAAQTVPNQIYENAATWNSSAWQLASVLGPALGGIVIAIEQQATLVYALDAGACLLCALLLFLLSIQARERSAAGSKMSLQALGEGVNFLRGSRILLAAITLDLFAVLLGGSTTLLPIFAKDILHVGPEGLGWLRAAPSIGAVCMALAIAHIPPFKKAGKTLLLAVAGFGLATLIFGLSHMFWLSLLALFILGGLDNISVVIRSTLLLTGAPDAMRGRVSAVNSLFIAASGQLGGFESGLVAQLCGPIFAVVSGGLGTLLIVVLVALLWPELRRLGMLKDASA